MYISVELKLNTMIDTKTLMLGNLVQRFPLQYDTVEVISGLIVSVSDSGFGLEMLRPKELNAIPITGRFLRKHLGFTVKSDYSSTGGFTNYISSNQVYVCHIAHDESGVYPDNTWLVGNEDHVAVEYIHELQNYFTMRCKRSIQEINGIN